MAKKKKINVAEAPKEKAPAEPKPTKKEKKAMEEQRRQELKAKRKQISIAAMLVAGSAVAINLASHSYSGQAIYNWILVGCYLLMAISGGIFIYGARYEETETKQRSKRAMGLIFVAAAISMVLMEGIPLLTK